MKNLRRSFLLDPRVTFLNHGSFGAVPRAVFREYQYWQRQLERQPVEFLGRKFTDLMLNARSILAEYINSDTDNVVFTPNVTFSINIVARSLVLGEGDEVLATDHEYGACDRTWKYLSRERNFKYINQPIPLAYGTPEEFVETLWKGVSPRTRVIFLSHITSPTSMVFPVAEVCRRARLEGILTVVDGAHAPGQIPVDMNRIGADFYGGNLHKWLCAPKGAGFLYVRPACQDLIKPLIVSWGYESEYPSNSRFVDYNEWTGTRDTAAYLAVPAAMEFQDNHDWDVIRKECHCLASEALQRINQLTGLLPINPDDNSFAQFISIPLPDSVDVKEFKKNLYDLFLVEAPLVEWNAQKFIRISVQGYNSRRDINQLIRAVDSLLKVAG